MKRCPKCNRTFTTDTQKFCTHDGGLLGDIGQETVRIETSDFDAPTKAISRDLISQVTAEIDPFKTVMTPRPEDTGAAIPKPPTEDLSEVTLISTAKAAEPAATDSAASAAPPPPPPVTPPVPQPATPPPSASVPVAPSAPPQAAAAAAQPARAAGVVPPKKKSKLLWVLGILAVLFILVVVVGVAAVIFAPKIKQSIDARRHVLPTPAPPRDDTNQPTPAPSVAPNDLGAPSSTPADIPTYTPPSNAAEFVNSSENLDGKLAEHYIDFSFYYPNNWEKDPKAGVPGASNFAKVERRLPPDLTQENFAVGWYSSGGSMENDRPVFHALVENFNSEFAKKFPEYRKISEGETKVGIYDGYEFRFEGVSRNSAKGDLKIWGRTVFVPPPTGQSNGVVMLMLTTSLASELKSLDDVGVKGELPMILESFRFGKK